MFRLILAMLSIGQDIRLPLSPSRPKCNSILHLFGEWLFEAALIGGESWKENLKSKIPFIHSELVYLHFVL